MTASTSEAEAVAAVLPAALAERSRAAFERLLAPDVRWGALDDTEQTCHNREQAGAHYAGLVASGVNMDVLRVSVHGQQVHARLRISGPGDGTRHEHETELRLTVRDGLVTDILQVDDGHAPAIELLYFDGCPNHGALLARLQRLLASHGIESPVRLTEVIDDESAQRLRFLGSPSLRIDGRDVEPGADDRHGYAVQCRLYRTPDGLSGAPSEAWILTALRR